MATLADLKAEIADDLNRTDLATQIASQINRAISHYQATRFFFNESRSVTFDAVADQQDYPFGDSEDIADFIHIDALFSTVSTTVRELRMIAPELVEILGDASSTRGEPTSYAIFDRKIRLYPIPDQVYAMRIQGHIKLAAPADSDTDNAWMNEAYELIRCRAKKYLALHILRNPELMQMMDAAERMAADQLHTQNTMRTGSGSIRPTVF